MHSFGIQPFPEIFALIAAFREIDRRARARNADPLVMASEKFRELDQMRADGRITPGEYEDVKRQILGVLLRDDSADAARNSDGGGGEV